MRRSRPRLGRATQASSGTGCFALASRKTSTTWLLSVPSAWSRAFWPFSSCVWIWAPAFMRTVTHWSCWFMAAHMRAVSPRFVCASRSHFLFMRFSTSMWFPACTAPNRAFWPSRSVWSTFAPPAMRNWQTSSRPNCAARSRAVLPCLVTRSTFASLLMRPLTVARWPSAAAHIRAVWCSLSSWFTLALFSMRNSQTSQWPFAAAFISAFSPFSVQ
mmetsp:Transcript_70642/g.223155  ORF Transcript_70642/g.223155 Transcript_70642/m.223155 type:complete len:216 (-) Transcript_70642:697-1344(-)